MNWTKSSVGLPPHELRVLIYPERWHEDVPPLPAVLSSDGWQTVVGVIAIGGTLWALQPEHPNKSANFECPACGAQYSDGDCCGDGTLESYRDCTENPDKYSQTWDETVWGFRKENREYWRAFERERRKVKS